VSQDWFGSLSDQSMVNQTRSNRIIYFDNSKNK